MQGRQRGGYGASTGNISSTGWGVAVDGKNLIEREREGGQVRAGAGSGRQVGRGIEGSNLIGKGASMGSISSTRVGGGASMEKISSRWGPIVVCGSCSKLFMVGSRTCPGSTSSSSVSLTRSDRVCWPRSFVSTQKRCNSGSYLSGLSANTCKPVLKE